MCKALKQQGRTAQKRLDRRVRVLMELSVKDHLSSTEKALLPIFRKAVHRAMQYRNRKRRQLAKATNAPSIPKIDPSDFNWLAKFRLILKTKGTEASQVFLEARLKATQLNS